MYNMAQQLFTTAISDFRLVYRDSSLRAFLFMPLIIILLINGFLPYLIDRFEVVAEYVPYVLMASILQTSTMFGFIYCMVLIDEKDIGVNKMYGVLPISKQGMIIYRLLFPYVFSTLFCFLILAIQPFYQFDVLYNVSLSLVVAVLGPIFILLITNYSSNKMQGLTWYKGVNALINIPLLVFFIPAGFSPLFYWIPTHWIFQSIYHYLVGGSYWLQLGIGFLLSVFVLILLVRQFSRKHFR